MEFYQVYLILGVAMAAVMLTEFDKIYSSAVKSSAELDIPVWVMAFAYSAVITIAAVIAWPWLLYNEWKESSKSLQ